MKTYKKLLIIGFTFVLGVCAPRAFGTVAVLASVQIRTVADFHEPLAAHGSWVEVRSYGRCWRPASVAVTWQPYSYGSWAWTDYGWYWESDEPWGWACYHYGSWIYDPDFGWVWIPGIEWSPAWVSWRTGGGYCGWAPLPPRGVVIAPRAFVFVESRNFHESVRPNTVIINNTAIINTTTEIKNTRREIADAKDAPASKVVINAGPKREEIEKASGNEIRAAAMRDLTQHERGTSGRPAAPAPEQNKTAPKRGNPAATTKDGLLIPDKPAPPQKPVPPPQPAPPEKPIPPQKPLPPTEPPTLPPPPTPPPNPVPPDKPSEINPTPEKPHSPTRPGERHERKPRSRNNDDSPGKENPS